MITTDDFKKAPDPVEKVKPLTKEELKWAKRLQKVLLDCPTSRLALVTIGDPDLNLIDKDYVNEYSVEISDGYDLINGVVLFEIESKPPIYGVSG